MTADELAAQREREVLGEHPDAEIAALDKCKHVKNLRILVEVGEAHTLADTEVTFIEVMACRNDSSYHDWGALLRPTTRAQGMHLFPDSVDLLIAHFPIVADEARAKGAGFNVALQHDFNKQLKTWRRFDPDSADGIAAALAALES